MQLPALIADGLGSVPGIGRLELRRVGNFGLKLLRRQITAVGLCKRDAVLVDVVAVSALDLGDLVAAAGNQADNVDPEDILHAAAGDGAVVFLRDGVQLVDHGGGSGPGIDGLFAGGDDVDPAGDALLDRLVKIADKAAGRDDGDIGVALVKNLVRIVRDDDARLYAQSGPVADVLAEGFAASDRTDDLRAVLIEIAERILAHFAAAILYNFDFFHQKKPPLLSC